MKIERTRCIFIAGLILSLSSAFCGTRKAAWCYDSIVLKGASYDSVGQSFAESCRDTGSIPKRPSVVVVVSSPYEPEIVCDLPTCSEKILDDTYLVVYNEAWDDGGFIHLAIENELEHVLKKHNGLFEAPARK